MRFEIDECSAAMLCYVVVTHVSSTIREKWNRACHLRYRSTFHMRGTFTFVTMLSQCVKSCPADSDDMHQRHSRLTVSFVKKLGGGFLG